MSDLDDDVPSFDALARRLCPDGACVGLVGADGTCQLCGMRDGGAPGSSGVGADSFPAGCAPGGDAAGSVDAGDFDAGRALCVDGACLGVIVGGVCNVCGRAAG